MKLHRLIAALIASALAGLLSVALTPDTDLVTVGIGGNDFGVFGRIIETCPAVRDEDPTGAPCKERFTVDGVDTLKADIAKTQLRIAEVAQGIKQRAPSATVVLVGYAEQDLQVPLGQHALVVGERGEPFVLSP